MFVVREEEGGSTSAGVRMAVLSKRSRSADRIALAPTARLLKGLSGAFLSDGSCLVTAGPDRAVRWWNAASGEMIREQATPHPAKAVAVSPTEPVIFAGTSGGELYAWDQLGATLRFRSALPRKSINALAVSPDGRMLASADAPGTVTFWNAATGAHLHYCYEPRATFYSVVFSPDGRLAAAAGTGDTVRLIDPTTGKLLYLLATDGLRHARAVAFSPDGTLLASGDAGQGIVLWDLATGEVMQRIDSGPVSALCFAADLQLILAGGEKGIRFWNITTRRCVGLLAQLGSRVQHVDLSPTNGQVLATCAQGVTRLWPAKPQLPAAQAAPAPVPVPVKLPRCNGPKLSVLHDAPVRGVGFMEGGKFALSVAADRQILSWFADSGHIRRQWKAVDAPHTASLSAGGLLALGNENGSVHLWQVPAGKTCATLFAHSSPVQTIAFAPADRRLAVQFANGRLALWDVTEGQQLWQRFERYAGPLAFTREGDLLACGGRGRIAWVAATSGGLVDILELPDEVRTISLAFTPDSKQMVSAHRADAGCWLSQWDLTTGGERMRQHTEGVSSLRLSPAGRHIVTGHIDGAIRIWDVHSLNLLRTLRGHFAAVTCLEIAPGGARLLSGSDDGTARLWDLD